MEEQQCHLQTIEDELAAAIRNLEAVRRAVHELRILQDRRESTAIRAVREAIEHGAQADQSQVSTPESEPELLRVSEAAKMLGVGNTTLWALIQHGELPSIRIGRSRRIPTRALRQWIEERTVR
jgi:excisionase family DNA binding protein